MNLQNMLKFKMAWAEPSGRRPEIVLSSRVRLARNLAQHPFPSRAEPKALLAVLEDCFAACRKTRALAKAAYVRLDDVEEVERLFLMERRLASPELCRQPKYRGVVVGEREILSLMVNEEDHLRLQAVDAGACLGELWSKLGSLESELPGVAFAFRADWGYLTACPTNTGTAMRASALLHLPGLTASGRINRILDGLSRAGLLARGLYGEGTRVLGDFYQVSNAVSLGKSEEEWIRLVEGAVSDLTERELEAQRAMADGAGRVRLQDLVYRSLGTLTHARSISFEEAMHHLSRARMALSLGWKMNYDLETLNELLVLAQPGHIQMLAGRELGPTERDFLRATLVRRKLKD